MAINLELMRKKLAVLKGEVKGGGSNSPFFRPEEGEQDIRIVPSPDGDPFKDFWFHYNVGNNPGFLSPKKNFGEDDPLNDFVRKLFNEGTEESIKMAKSLMALSEPGTADDDHKPSSAVLTSEPSWGKARLVM